MLKVKFEDLQKNFPLLGHQSWRLRKFSKFFEKIFFAQMLPNGPIRKVITLKVKFEDLRLHLSLWRHGSRLRKFFDRKFFDQKRFFFKVSKWFNSQSYQVKIEIWKNIPFSAHYEGILARHLENSSKSNKLNMSSKMNKLNKWDNLHKSRSQFWSWGQVRQARYSSYLSHGGPHKFLLVCSVWRK